MLVIIAILCVVFLAYALTFDKISDAVPKRVSDAVAQKTGMGQGGGDKS
jgi:hypothetical protein